MGKEVFETSIMTSEFEKIEIAKLHKFFIAYAYELNRFVNNIIDEAEKAYPGYVTNWTNVYCESVVCSFDEKGDRDYLIIMNKDSSISAELTDLIATKLKAHGYGNVLIT